MSLLLVGLVIVGIGMAVFFYFFNAKPVTPDPETPPNVSLEEVDACAGTHMAAIRRTMEFSHPRGKGWIKSPETGKRLYPMRAVRLMSTRSATVIKRLWLTGSVLDQGPTPECVAFSGVQYLKTAPIQNNPAFSPLELYEECKKIDGFAGEDGTTVEALFKVLKAKGFVESFHWAETTDDAINWILNYGPVVMGFLVDGGVFEDAEGDFFVNISGQGDGHAVLLSGADIDKLCPDGSRGAARLTNSWGTGWYCGGKAWISFTDLKKVLDTGGELVAAVEKIV